MTEKKSHNNHHLSEVLCAIWFRDKEGLWDSTFYGKFYENLMESGFSEKQEHRGLQIKLRNSGEGQLEHSSEDLESKLVFINPKGKCAITMAQNYLSFHKLEPYENWEHLIEKIVKPGLDIYEKKLKLSLEVLAVQALYLNVYEMSKEQSLAQYLRCVPEVEGLKVEEKENTQINTTYRFEPNLRQQFVVKSVIKEGKRVAQFQCSCVAENIEGDSSWEQLAQAAHDKNFEVWKTVNKGNS